MSTVLNRKKHFLHSSDDTKAFFKIAPTIPNISGILQLVYPHFDNKCMLVLSYCAFIYKVYHPKAKLISTF